MAIDASPGSDGTPAAPPRKGTRLGTLAIRVALALASTIVAVFAVDFVLRATSPMCPRDLAVIDPHVGWRHRPSIDRRFSNCSDPRSEFETRVRFDGNGFRGPGRDLTKPAGVWRILLLGDSFTEALQVEEEGTFAFRLERLLETPTCTPGGGPGCARVEVWNAGVSGYGTDNELLAWRNGLAALAPDVVLLVMSQNDVYENSRELIEAGPLAYPDKPFFVRHAEGALELKNNPVPPFSPPPWKLRRWLDGQLRESPLYRLATGALRSPEASDVRMIGGLGQSGNLTFLQQYLQQPPKTWDKARILTADLVRTLTTEVQQTGARMAIVVVPDKRALLPELLRAQVEKLGSGLRWNAARPYETILGIARESGLPYRGLLPAFAEHYASTGDSGFLRVDIHFSTTGHEIAAREIHEMLLAEGLVPGA